MTKWQKLEDFLVNFIKDSRKPDYINHAITSRDWLLEMYPEATEEMKMAAFAHDIERCFFTRMFVVENEEYLQYKMRHAARCADILVAMMAAFGFTMEECQKVHHLVSLHEAGGDFEADLIRDADSISFMSNNLPGYYAGRLERARGKVEFMYGRASDKAKQIIRGLDYSSNPEMETMVREVFESLK